MFNLKTVNICKKKEKSSRISRKRQNIRRLLYRIFKDCLSNFTLTLFLVFVVSFYIALITVTLYLIVVESIAVLVHPL